MRDSIAGNSNGIGFFHDIAQEFAQGGNVLHGPNTQEEGNRAEGDQAVRRPSFQPMDAIAEPFGWIRESSCDAVAMVYRRLGHDAHRIKVYRGLVE